MVATYKPDIINANETHIDNSILSSEILGGNYTIFRKDRNLNGGVVLTAVSNKLIATHESNLDSNCEAVWMKVHVMGNKPLYVTAKCTFYFQQFAIIRRLQGNLDFNEVPID